MLLNPPENEEEREKKKKPLDANVSSNKMCREKKTSNETTHTNYLVTTVCCHCRVDLKGGERELVRSIMNMTVLLISYLNAIPLMMELIHWS